MKMYPKTEDSSLRIFSPIILFHDANSCCSDSKTIQLKKQKVTAMLQTNGVFWSSVIQSTRHHPTSPPPSPDYKEPVDEDMEDEEEDEDDEDEDEDEDEDTEEDDNEKENKRYKSYRYQKRDSMSCSLPSDDGIVLDGGMDFDSDQPQKIKNKAIAATTTTIAPKLIRLKSSNGRKRRGNLPKIVTAILKQWLVDHSRHPYPTEDEKRALKQKTNLTLNQISNWFINARRRILPVILSSPPHNEQQQQSFSKGGGRKRLTNEMGKDINKKDQDKKSKLKKLKKDMC